MARKTTAKRAQILDMNLIDLIWFIYPIDTLMLSHKLTLSHKFGKLKYISTWMKYE